MKCNLNAKVFTSLLIVLICCDAPLLFAAENGVNGPGAPLASTANNGTQDEQLQFQQLQQMAANPGTQQPTAPQSNQPAVVVVPPANTNLPNQAEQGQTGFQSAPQATPGAQQRQPAQQQATSPEQALSDAAFMNVARSALPMTPDQIQRLRQLFNTTQYAVAAAPGVPPRPVIRSQFVNLAPGTTPPPVRLKQGVVTSLAFLDSTGQPWPIEAYDVGDPATFSVQWNKSDNLLFIQPSKPYYEERNLVVRLKDLHTPVTLTLLSPQLSDNNAVDYRVDLHLSGLGPNASPVALSNLPNSANPELLGVLSGLPPVGARELTIIGGGDSQVWLAHDKLYLRTRLAVLSPGWLASMSSADGMRAYEMQRTPMLLVSQNGRTVQLKVEGF